MITITITDTDKFLKDEKEFTSQELKCVGRIIYEASQRTSDNTALKKFYDFIYLFGV